MKLIILILAFLTLSLQATAKPKNINIHQRNAMGVAVWMDWVANQVTDDFIIFVDKTETNDYEIAVYRQNIHVKIKKGFPLYYIGNEIKYYKTVPFKTEDGFPIDVQIFDLVN